jgi:hypothetical protein
MYRLRSVWHSSNTLQAGRAFEKGGRNTNPVKFIFAIFSIMQFSAVFMPLKELSETGKSTLLICGWMCFGFAAVLHKMEKEHE